MGFDLELSCAVRAVLSEWYCTVCVAGTWDCVQVGFGDATVDLLTWLIPKLWSEK